MERKMREQRKITSYQLCRGTANGEDFEKSMSGLLEGGFVPYGDLVSCGDYIIQPMVFYGVPKSKLPATSTREKIEVMEAYEGGKTIQGKNKNGVGDWRDICYQGIVWDWANVEYRVKDD